MAFFILALIGRMELHSLYDFRQRASLEPGAIRNTLRHLETEELLTRSESGRRRRRDFSLTPEGRRLLAETWTASMTIHPDAESVLRTAFLAWTMAGPEEANRYLIFSAKDREQKAAQKKQEAEYRRRRITEPLSVHAWMRAVLEAHRQTAEKEVFEVISGIVKTQFLSPASGERADSALEGKGTN